MFTIYLLCALLPFIYLGGSWPRNGKRCIMIESADPFLDPRSCFSHSSTNTKKLGSKVWNRRVACLRLSVGEQLHKVWIPYVGQVGSFCCFHADPCKAELGSYSVADTCDTYCHLTLAPHPTFFFLVSIFKLSAPLSDDRWTMTRAEYNPMVQTSSFFSSYFNFFPFFPIQINRLPAPSRPSKKHTSKRGCAAYSFHSCPSVPGARHLSTLCFLALLLIPLEYLMSLLLLLLHCLGF